MNLRINPIIFAAAVCLTAASIFGADRAEVADAAMKGNQALVRTLLQQKADVNAIQVDGATALHWAVYRSDLELAQLLIKAGAKVEAKNREGITPLYMASAYDNSDLIQSLLTAGADAKQKGPNGET